MIKLTRNLARLACLAVATVAVMGFAPSANAETTIYSSSGEVLATGEVAVCLPGESVCQEAGRPWCQYPDTNPANCNTCKYKESCMACCTRVKGVQNPGPCQQQHCQDLKPEPDNEFCFKVDKSPGVEDKDPNNDVPLCKGYCTNKQDCFACCTRHKNPNTAAQCHAACDKHWESQEPDFVVVVE